MRLQQQGKTKSLRGLNRPQAAAVRRRLYDAFSVHDFDRILHRYGKHRRFRQFGLPQASPNMRFRCKRAHAIVNEHPFDTVPQRRQPLTDGILAFLPACEDCGYFRETVCPHI